MQRWGLAALAVIAILMLGFTGWLYAAGPWRAVNWSAQAPAPSPALFGDGETIDAWQAQRDALLGAFEHDVYGGMPAPIAPSVSEKNAIAHEDAGGFEGVEQWRVNVGAAGYFHLVVARPPGDTPAPVILVLDFCGNRAAVPGRPDAIAPPVGYIQSFCNNPRFDRVAEAVFGAHVNSPPFAEIMAHGYAIALLYAGDIVPDEATQARTALARFAPDDTGAIMGWAWTASRAYEALADDPRFDAARIAVWGQSRQGKTAIVAGAFDRRFAAVVALQSGRGGDAPSHAFEGETVAEITAAYPHWFAARFAEAAPSVEQHQLLALIAPRPLLLGYAGRDRWADPIGARAIYEAATPAWTLYGAEPPSTYHRNGGHGIHPRDWRETLNFLDARMGG